MTADDLEERLRCARERVARATEAMRPTHSGGEGEEFRAARQEQLDAERALSLSRIEGSFEDATSLALSRLLRR